MPELPEVETTKTSLTPLLGQKVTKVQVFQPKLRWQMPDDLNDLVDHVLVDVQRRAKYLILDFAPVASKSNGFDKEVRQLLVHLGMSGSLQQHASGADKRKHDHLIITFRDDDGALTQLHYHDPRRFGSVLWHQDYKGKLLDNLGLEPLSETFDADYLYQFIQRTDAAKHKPSDPNSRKVTARRPITRAIKSVIMEQQVVVGVGNIYATESLYLAGIHPATPANEVSYKQLSILVTHIKTILHKAIALGGSTLRDFTVASGETGYFQQTLNVYGRQGEACPSCNADLDSIKLNGRASVFCPECQTL
ncbi:bifunctional DNA-formamidopyrimidine glycosylase/DNA-(apurinic or apyrimidinic site) lyase [Psychrobacter sp. T6-1]|uniref:bifunctional DNA-formamidopyrimidine glycosylase/DNA-(apurinic or apyrimidinic site) lyase n=1 Tax=Psychrobacter sp. T6-1 TaxID=3457447 RepID=UPI003FD639A5